MDERKKNFTQISFDDTGIFLEAGSTIKFESTNFKEITHNGDGTMDVTYRKTGAVYRYHGVPPTLFHYIKKQVDRGSKTLGQELYNELIAKPDIYPFERII